VTCFAIKKKANRDAILLVCSKCLNFQGDVHIGSLWCNTINILLLDQDNSVFKARSGDLFLCNLAKVDLFDSERGVSERFVRMNDAVVLSSDIRCEFCAHFFSSGNGSRKSINYSFRICWTRVSDLSLWQRTTWITVRPFASIKAAPMQHSLRR